jgi:hypothetical protein
MLSLLVGLATLTPAADPVKPTRVLLWPKDAPMAVGDTPRDKPALTIYLPEKEKRTRTAVVVCPGGGYGTLAMNHEGKEIADWLVQRGVAAFVLEYRLGPRYRFPVPLLDAQRALRLVRSRAREFGVDDKRIGIWGFSAGGHLASTASTRFDKGRADAADPIDRSCRLTRHPLLPGHPPDAFGHAGSRRNLWAARGETPDQLCNDTQVTKAPDLPFHNKLQLQGPREGRRACWSAIPNRTVSGWQEIQEKDWPGKLEDWLKERAVARPRSPMRLAGCPAVRTWCVAAVGQTRRGGFCPHLPVCGILIGNG